ncbi:MAG: KPN_02809 family neutral zinc metallopeptidase [Chitinophagaceae bacterium]
MLWQGRRESSNVEDRRGISGWHVALGGGIGGVIIILVISLILGKYPLQFFQRIDSAGTEQILPAEQKNNDESAVFAKVVLADTEDVWNRVFQKIGKQYVPPVMVLYSGEVESACGMNTAASGPFYCPADAKLYIDLSFFNELKNRFHVAGNFADAYVIAHEVGHHVQNLLGITRQVEALQSRASKKESDALSVRLELQADFFAGLWAHYDDQWNHVLESGDIQNALQAANAVGDDRLQKGLRGYVVPDSFTHGTSEQRMHWFMKGYQTGDISEGDTFSAASL